MKTLKLFALVGIFCGVTLSLPTYAQLSGEFPNYVVIGAFKFHRNAVRFTTHAHDDLQLNAKFEMNPNRKLYYVYVLNTPDRSEAIAEARRLRGESEFKDTWVFSGPMGKEVASNGSYAGVDINPVTEKVIERVQNSETLMASADPSTIAPAPEEKVVEKPAPAEDDKVIGKKFYFKISRDLDKQPLQGDVDLIDHEKLRKVGTYKGNADVKVPTPPGKSGSVSLVCEIFGYRKLQRDIDYNNPEAEDITQNDNGSVVVPFDLVRLQKGDIAVMFNVYFFKDAAVMRPESRYEVTSLLEMLKENEKYKIRIHGHTNGNHHGRIVTLEESNTNYFSLNDTQEGFASAKKLSEARANLIRNFLVSSGVDPSRMQIKAWGGKRPIHDKHSSRAQENVRVEIEILDN